MKTIQEYKANTRLGNNIVNYFTLEERLHTKGKAGISFIEFWDNIETYKAKPYILSMFEYYERTGTYKNQPEKIAKGVFNLYFGAINIFKPITTMNILEHFPIPHTLLDPCAGWGGRLIGASLKGVPKYVGIDTNTNLIKPYEKMKVFLSENSPIEIEMYFCDATTFDYSGVKYDMVLTSPPYEAKEIYSGMVEYMDWYKGLYEPLFRRSWEGLEAGGIYILNIPQKIYAYAVKVLGEAQHTIPFMKYSRNNSYRESFYVWRKPLIEEGAIAPPETPAPEKTK